jgi:hypothetical protein
MQEGSMTATTAAPPPRDSVLDALGYAVRVLAKPGFLWAPILLYLILMLPLLPLYTLPWMTGAGPTLVSQEDLEAALVGLIPWFGVYAVVSILLTPVVLAVSYRLAQQYIEGEEPLPFGAGFVNLAWRYFLQTLLFFALAVVGVLALVLAFFVLQAIAGVGLAILLTVVGAFVAYVFVILRVGLAPVLLLWGAGPVESIGRSWALTRGQLGRVFRWLTVSAVVVSVAAGVVGAVVGAVFGAFGQPIFGQLMGTLIAAPLGLVGSIVIVLLARLLSSPVPPSPPPATALPDWMNPSGPAGEPPTAPSN